jgi:hypothetical protein
LLLLVLLGVDSLTLPSGPVVRSVNPHGNPYQLIKHLKEGRITRSTYGKEDCDIAIMCMNFLSPLTQINFNQGRDQLNIVLAATNTTRASPACLHNPNLKGVNGSGIDLNSLAQVP